MYIKDKLSVIERVILRKNVQRHMIFFCEVYFLGQNAPCRNSFLAHLSHRLRVSYCHWPMSVVCRASSTIALNNISSETARPRALIFGMYHCLMDFYQVCSNGCPGVRNGPAAGSLGFKTEIYFRIFISRTALLRCLKFGM